MASIGGSTVTGWSGTLDEWAHRDISVERAAPGMPGNIAVVGNYAQAATEIITTIERRSLSEARDWSRSCVELEGRTVNVVDPHGITFQGVFVQRAATRYARTVAGTYYAITTWLLVPRSQAAY